MAKLLLTARDIGLSYGMRTVLDIDHFELYDGERVGLVGLNGAGKTTLIRVLSGALTPDSGVVDRLAEISVIAQTEEEGSRDLAIDDGHLQSEFRAQPWRDGLSGGEKTRRRIAGALGENRHILLADEPTSDLDQEGLNRLTRFLVSFEGAVVLISHDRTLLDRVCTAILELEEGHLKRYPGNYTAYRHEKERQRAFQRFEYDQYRSEKARLSQSIQSKKEHSDRVGKLPKRMGNSEARLHKRSATEIQEKLNQTQKALRSRLGQLKEKERPREDPSIRMRLGEHTPIVSRTALEVRGMTLRFPGKVLIEDARMTLPTGSKTALIGQNGCGKTTLIRRIIGGNDPRIRINPGAKLGFFGQDHAEVLDFERTALKNAMIDSVYPESDVRTVLARLNLRGDNVFKKVAVLSGGERAKIALARLFVSDINVLILDEPTNHLDIFSLEALEDVLKGYGGTLLFVSHDRRFTSAVADRLVFFEGKRLTAFEGGMEEYLARQSAGGEQRAELNISVLQMRMAALAERMAKPKQDDDMEKLNAEYFELAGQVRALRDGATGPSI